MSTKVDWLSWSCPVRYSSPNDEAYAIAIENALCDQLGKWLCDALFSAKWKLQDHGRQPYKHVWKRDDAPIVMFTHPNLNHMTVEASGQGCDWLREQGLFDVLLEHVSDRVTRLDLATDIETCTTPTEFCSSGVSERFTARGIYTSDTGETVYVGSQKSEKFARVYRYAPPHPRSGLLRVEHVCRRDQAKVIARMLSDTPIENVAASLGASFGWQNAAWSLRGLETQSISTVRGERSASGTVRWLITSVAPAFKRMVQQGEIQDAEQFVRSYFLGLD